MTEVSIPELSGGPVSGEFDDSAGIHVSYCIRAADGAADLFRVVIEASYNSYDFQSSLEHSEEMGTIFYSMKMRHPYTTDFEDLTNVVACAFLVQNAIGRGFGGLAEECFVHALKKMGATNVAGGRFQ